MVYTFSKASTDAAVNFNLDLYAAKSTGAVGLMCFPALVCKRTKSEKSTREIIPTYRDFVRFPSQKIDRSLHFSILHLAQNGFPILQSDMNARDKN